MVATATKKNNKTKLIISSTSTTTRATTIQSWSTTNTKVWALNNFSFIQEKKIQEAESYERRVMCGNSCLTREEAKHKYHCDGHCQVLSGLYFAKLLNIKFQGKSEPCRSKEEAICPQHYQLCGRDTCIDRWWWHVQWSQCSDCILASRVVTLPLWLCPDGLQASMMPGSSGLRQS